MGNKAFQEFAPVDYETWKQLAEKTLKDKPFESICTTTYENIVLKPLYTKEDVKNSAFEQTAALFPVSRNMIAQEIWGQSVTETNQILSRALDHGQTILHLVVDQATLQGKDSDITINDAVLRNGVPISCAADLESVFNGIDVRKHSFLLYTGFLSVPLLSMLFSYVREKDVPFSSVTGVIGADPLGYWAEVGKLSASLEQCYDALALAVKWSKQQAPNIRTVLIRTDMYHNAGANAVQEMAIALATAVEYMREGIKRGIDAREMCRQFAFTFSVGTHLFTEIAKLRAIRVLWKKVAESFGVEDDAANMKLHVRTSKRTKTLYDPHVNLLRTTTEAFSAIVGGADTLHVSTYNEAYNETDESATRWARNIQHILQGESHLSKVIDPANGSYYVEALTEELAKQAWQLFQQIEARGGMSEVLKQGWIQQEVAAVAKGRYENIISLKQKIVGTNVYVNKVEVRLPSHENEQQCKQNRISELMKYKEQRNTELLKSACSHYSLQDEQTMEQLLHAYTVGLTIGEVVSLFQAEEEKIKPLKPMRDSEPFEVLRETAEKYEQIKGVRPQVTIVQITAEEKKGKVQPLITSALEGCGFSVQSKRQHVEEELTVEEGVHAIFLDGDKESIENVLTALQDKNEQVKLFVMGSFSEHEERQLLQQGIRGFIHETSNLLPLLYELHNELEVIV
ncbi:methylmalonyl-CoA mutase subunit beta [Microbacteriaceae bacterium 4G12]